MSNYKTINGNKGEILEINYDEHCDSPREFDVLTTMICFHRRYVLGDEHGYKESNYDGWSEMKESILECENILIIKPLYMYDHSGITISTSPFSCGWDSGQIGFVIVTKKDYIKLYGSLDTVNEDTLNEVLESEVEMYDNYLKGECFRFMLTDENDEVVDSCSGFLGYENLKEDICNYVPEKYNYMIEQI